MNKLNQDWNVFPVGVTVPLGMYAAKIEVSNPKVVRYGKAGKGLTAASILVQNRPITWGQVRKEVRI